MKIALFLNPVKNGIFEYAEKVIKKLKNFDKNVCVYRIQNSFYENVCLDRDADEFIKKCDVILTIGGDGTIIRLAKYAAKFSKPVLGINFGRLGFITGIERNELDKLELLVEGKYAVKSRALLEVVIYKGGNTKTFLAVNDAVISKGERTRIVDFFVKLNDAEVCSYCADGLILSTATGSTAYSLSAGGPIISPDIDCILMTPICPHSMFAKPVVFSDKNSVEIVVAAKDNGRVLLNIDGDIVSELSNFDKVIVKCADEKVDIISFDDRNFYKRLSQKLLDNCIQ